MTNREEQLKSCPFCGGCAYIQSNRDWHRVVVNHTDDCIFDDDESELVKVAATNEYLEWMIKAWNTRPDESSYANDVYQFIEGLARRTPDSYPVKAIISQAKHLYENLPQPPEGE